MTRVQELIEALALQPHPEGGYYRETYRSEGVVNAYGGERNHSTCIYFLLTADRPSHFHRIRQDELWHFYDGETILLHVISPNGEYTLHRIGRDFSAGEVPQCVVPGGSWFASEVEKAWALAGCTVSPGFDFDDFQMASRAELLALYPQCAHVITRLASS